MPQLNVDYGAQVVVNTGQYLNIGITTGAQKLYVAFVSGPPGRDGADGSGFASGIYPLYYDSSAQALAFDTGFLNSGYYPLNSNPSGYTTLPFVTGISGAITDLITAASQGVSALNGLSGFITLFGTGNITITNDGQNIIISGSDSSVNVNVSGYITTGDADARYYPLNANPSGYLTSLSGVSLDLINGLSGFLSNALFQTGSSLWNDLNNNAINLSGNLAQTGSNLYDLTTGLSGFLSNLTPTISGYITSGDADLRYYSINNPSGFITGISTGDFVTRNETGQFASATNLTQTGLDLLALINASSAGVSSLNGLSGAVNINGFGNVFITSNGQDINISGDTGIYSNFATILELYETGSLIYQLITGLSGVVDNANYYPSSNPSGFITGINTGDFVTRNETGQFASVTALYQTGADLFALISASSAGVGSLNSLSGAITLAGAGNVSISIDGQTIIISGNTGEYADFAKVIDLFSTGSNLYNLITGLSGVVDAANYYPSSNPSGYITGIDTSEFVTRNETGQFASANDLTQSGIDLLSIIVNSGEQAIIHSNGIGSGLSGNLLATGDLLYDIITGLSGQAQNDFATKVELTQTGIDLTNTIISTGNSAVIHANGIGSGLSGDLVQTGIQLGNKIDVLSGYANDNFATISNLESTGQTLFVRDTSISGGLEVRIFESGFTGWTHSQNNALNLSGNLTLTGQTLHQRTTGLSGFLIGLISAASAGVSSLNGQSGVMTLEGTGGISVFTVGQTIYISGEADPTFFATVPFVTGVSGVLQGYIDLLDSELFDTGSLLYNIITGLSGVFYPASNPQQYVTSGNLFATGSTLDNKINSLSGFVDITSGSIQLQINELYPRSNPSGYITGISTGDFVTRAETGQFYPASNPQNYATSGDLFATGSILDQKVNTLSGFTLGSSGGLEVRITQTGNAAVIHSNGIGSGLSGNLTQTGISLINRSNLISGFLATGLTNTGSVLNTRITSLSGFTNNVSGALNVRLIGTGTSAINHANGIGSGLSGNLTQTGINLIIRDNAISGVLQGQINELYPRSNPSGYITGISTGDFITRNETGQFYPASNPQQYVTSGNLYESGSILNGKINSLSGFVIDSSGGLEQRIIQTGNSAIIHSNGIGSGLSGDLSNTGSLLASTSGSSFIGVGKIGNSTYGTVKDFFNLYVSPGTINVLNAGYIRPTEGVSGSIDVLGGSGVLRVVDDDISENVFITWPTSGNILIPTGSTNFIGVEYNAGNPRVTVRNSQNWDLDTNFPLGIVVRLTGQKLNIINDSWWTNDATTNIIQRFEAEGRVYRDNIAGGLILGDKATRFVTTTSGTLWSRLNTSSIPAIDTSLANNNFTAYSYNGSIWNETVQTQWDNTNYNNISVGLVEMTNNRFSNRWFFMSTDASLSMVFGTNEYTTAASAADEPVPPNIPPNLIYESVLIGRMIIQKNATTATNVESAFLEGFTAGVASDHGNLNGLLDDDHPQYLLTNGGRQLSNDWNAALNITGRNLVAQRNIIFTSGLFSGTTNIADIFATKNQLTQTGVDLITRDNNISGTLQTQINELYPRSNPSGYITGISTGEFVTRNETGQFASATNLFQTGADLDSKINILSGYSDATFATLENLTATGQQLSAVRVTGSNTINNANLTGLGGTIVLYSGDSIFISGGASGPGGGVTTVNGLNGDVIITGTGAVFTYVIDGQIYVSGDTSMSGALQAQINNRTGYQFFTTGFPAGTTSFYVNFPSGMSTVPVVVPHVNVTGDLVYGLNIKDVSQTGFFALITNTTQSSEEVTLNVHVIESGGTVFGVGAVGGGSVNSASNIGVGTGLFSSNVLGDLQFKSIEGTGSINLVTIGDTIFISGQESAQANNSDGINLSGNLYQTGSTLDNKINVLSGFVINVSGGLENRLLQSGNLAIIHANGIGSGLSGNLTQTGIDLILRDNSISGGLEARIIQTGNSAIVHANGIGINLSGNLTQTGVNLINRDIAVSGGLEARITQSGNNTISHSNGIGTILSGNLTTTGSALNNKINALSGFSSSPRAIIGVIDGGGEVITTGIKMYLPIPYNCTVNNWTIVGDVAGSIVVDVRNATYANFPTTTSIAGTEKPTLSAVQKNQDLSLTTWSTPITGGNILSFLVESASTVRFVTVQLGITIT